MKPHTAIAFAIALAIMLALGVWALWPLFATLRVRDTTHGTMDSALGALDNRYNNFTFVQRIDMSEYTKETLSERERGEIP